MVIMASEEQREKIALGQPHIDLLAPCKLGEGIIAVSDESAKYLREQFLVSSQTKAFFIPASGSGSRMFEFLFDFVEQPSEENRGKVERFLNHIEDFAFLYQFPKHIQKQLRERTMEIDAFVAYILNDNGMGLAHLPKGLIPFHKNGPFILNPFQEHFLQGTHATNDLCSFHFTIQPQFQQYIERSLKQLEGVTGKSVAITFSEQDSETDAFAFDSDGEMVYDELGNPLRRPAGHGALLPNLNRLDADLIFIKNIDNVQHWDQSNDSIEAQQLIGGLLISLQDEINRLLKTPTKEAIVAFNEHYQLFHQELMESPLNELIELLKRPIRACGMVRNEGQPGGGPFWIRGEKGISKQIIEKAQIGLSGEQYRQMIQSTHFNPVLMGCSGRLYDGSKVDFEQFSESNHYFIVKKKYRGKDIQFIEAPGLWNGSMSYWNTVFVEIPSTAFSPVKTILDLLETAHQGEK